MRIRLGGLLAMSLLLFSSAAGAQPSEGVPTAIFTDPVHDAANPASMEVLHVPSGGVAINGVAYVAAGAGPHPLLVLCHGRPGNEKNLDLAQAVRRAGWTVVTFNYRGSWGSPGSFSFSHNVEDGRAVLTYLREPVVAQRIRADTTRIVMAGHSMGGSVTALTSAGDSGLKGTILISATNMGGLQGPGGKLLSRDELAKRWANSMESLADTSPEKMAEEAVSGHKTFDWTGKGRALAGKPLLVLTSDDGQAASAEALAAEARAAGGRVAVVHVATDHSWSNQRIRLESEVIRWLEGVQ